MKILPSILVIGIAVFCRADAPTNAAPAAAPSGQTVETLVCIRHGEKPLAALDN